ncbi:MAG: hypothetical protein P4L96_09935 [Rhodoferax sp.]|nr:hypothetical protein [Rhodoferax sp.]
MSTPSTPAAAHPATPEQDPIEGIVPMIPLVIPLVGGVLIFLLAFIAVFLG